MDIKCKCGYTHLMSNVGFEDEYDVSVKAYEHLDFVEGESRVYLNCNKCGNSIAVFY